MVGKPEQVTVHWKFLTRYQYVRIGAIIGLVNSATDPMTRICGIQSRKAVIGKCEESDTVLLRPSVHACDA